MGKFCFALCLLLTLSSQSFGESNKLWNETNVDKLKAELLENYDRFNRPENIQVPSTCHLALTVIHMELDETRGVLETHAWLRMNWSDSKLKWDPKAYGDVYQLNVAADEVWQPDLTVYNSAEPTVVDHFAKTNKILYPNGNVLWVPTSKFETYCQMDLKMWPFDTQKCEIKIGSWTYSAYQINLRIWDSPPVDSTHFQNMEWEIVKGTAERHETIYPCCPEPYPDITFYLTFRRRSPMYKAIAVVPAIVVVFLTLSAFWLPPQAGEKLLLNGIACIMICILLMYFSRLLPILATSSPIIVTFYSHTLYLLCISFVISVTVINMSRNRKRKPVPSSVKSAVLNGFLGKIFGGQQADSSAEHQVEELKDTPFEENRTSDGHQIIQSSAKYEERSIHNDWIHLAIIIDRLAFIVYIIIFLFMGFTHFV